MGVNMELEFDKYCKVGRSPRTVLPSPQHPKKGERRSRKGRPSSKNEDYDLISLEEKGFREIKFRNYRSVSCKNLPSGDIELECNDFIRRGSVYQSTTDRRFRTPETRGGRKKSWVLTQQWDTLFLQYSRFYLWFRWGSPNWGWAEEIINYIIKFRQSIFC